MDTRPGPLERFTRRRIDLRCANARAQQAQGGIERLERSRVEAARLGRRVAERDGRAGVGPVGADARDEVDEQQLAVPEPPLPRGTADLGGALACHEVRKKRDAAPGRALHRRAGLGPQLELTGPIAQGRPGCGLPRVRDSGRRTNRVDLVGVLDGTRATKFHANIDDIGAPTLERPDERARKRVQIGRDCARRCERVEGELDGRRGAVNIFDCEAWERSHLDVIRRARRLVLARYGDDRSAGVNDNERRCRERTRARFDVGDDTREPGDRREVGAYERQSGGKLGGALASRRGHGEGA